MPIVADYDRDGFLDVYVVRMGDHEHTAPDAELGRAQRRRRDSLYHNNGDGTFTDVDRRRRRRRTRLGPRRRLGRLRRRRLARPLRRQRVRHQRALSQQRDGTFREVGAAAGALDRGAAMGVAWGDYDNDGDLDLFVSNMYANSRWALFHPDFPPPVPWYLRWVPRDRRRHASSTS